MKTIKALTILFLCLTAKGVYAQETYLNDVTVAATGSFGRSVSGDGVTQSSGESPGVLFTYRYFVTDRQGLELNYGLSRVNEQFAKGTSSGTGVGVSSNVNEANLSYVVRFRAGHRLQPFLSAGVGALVISPVNGFTVNGASGTTFATPDFVYSGGVEITLGRRMGLRLGYRGHLFQAPDFGVAALATGAVGQTAQPFGGLSFHF
jgi:opacity protein-like surface antigen